MQSTSLNTSIVPVLGSGLSDCVSGRNVIDQTTINNTNKHGHTFAKKNVSCRWCVNVFVTFSFFVTFDSDWVVLRLPVTSKNVCLKVFTRFSVQLKKIIII